MTVTARRHAYEADPHSGAGNCACGAPEQHARHPHTFRRAADSENCVCWLGPEAPQHVAALAPEPFDEYKALVYAEILAAPFGTARWLRDCWRKMPSRDLRRDIWVCSYDGQELSNVAFWEATING